MVIIYKEILDLAKCDKVGITSSYVTVEDNHVV